MTDGGFFEIRVTGHLHSRWAAWFDGLTVTTEEDGGTAFSGPIQDQAALFGILAKVRDAGLSLVSVNRVDR